MDAKIAEVFNTYAPKIRERLKANIPILDWLPRYDRTFLKADVLAGLTTGAVVIPAAIGWASLAGLPSQFGLYAAVASLLAYFVFGTSRHLIVAPSSGPAALVGAGLVGLTFADANQYIAAVAMLALLSGLLLIFAWIIKLGFVVNFISETVLVGFQVGLALYIISLQLGRFLGISGASGSFFQILAFLGQHITEASLPTIALGLIAFAFLFWGKKFIKRIPLKFLLIILATVAAILFPLVEGGIEVVGYIPQGLPDFVVPSTGGQSLNSLMTVAIGLFLITYIEGVSIGKTFARKGGYELNSDQELLAYGSSNVAASFFQGMPLNGSSSNTAVNFENKAKTQVAGAVAAGVIVLVLLFFASFFSNLPRVIVAVIIISSMIALVDFKAIRHIYDFERKEFIYAMAAMFGVLFFGILQGIFLGVAITLLALLYRISRPSVVVLGRIPGTMEYTGLDRSPDNICLPNVLVLRLDSPLIFPNVARVKEEVRRLVKESKAGLVVLSMRSSPYMDLPATEMLGMLYDELQEGGTTLKIAEASGPVRDSIRKAGLDDRFGGLSPGMSVQGAIDAWHNPTEDEMPAQA